MADREKVIKGLEFCTQHGSMCGSDCNGHYERYTDDGYVSKLVNEYRSKCPYGKCETGCVKTLAKDALELLKERSLDENKYQYKIDHTDCVWYSDGENVSCPVTCSQYRDGWNDAMDFVFKGGRGYRPYKRW